MLHAYTFTQYDTHSLITQVIQRLQKVHIIVDEITSTAKEVETMPNPTLQPFSLAVSNLLVDYSPEYEKYKLDEIVVAAIAPVVSSFCYVRCINLIALRQMRRLLYDWKPLEDPDFMTTELRSWKKALVLSPVPSLETQIAFYGGSSRVTVSSKPVE